MEFSIGDRVVCNGEVDFYYSTRGECGWSLMIPATPAFLYSLTAIFRVLTTATGR